MSPRAVHARRRHHGERRIADRFAVRRKVIGPRAHLARVRQFVLVAALHLRPRPPAAKRSRKHAQSVEIALQVRIRCRRRGPARSGRALPEVYANRQFAAIAQVEAQPRIVAEVIQVVQESHRVHRERRTAAWTLSAILMRSSMLADMVRSIGSAASLPPAPRPAGAGRYNCRMVTETSGLAPAMLRL